MAMTIRNLTISLALIFAFAAWAPAQPPKQWTTISGQVVLQKDEQLPLNKIAVPINRLPAFCLPMPIFEEQWQVNATNRGIKNVVVSLVPVGYKRGDKFPVDDIHPQLAKSAKPIVQIDQPSAVFEPHILAMRDDQTLHILNSTPIMQNAKLVGPNINLNVNIPAKGRHIENGIKADIFPNHLSNGGQAWMNAKVLVFDHPYFAVTDEDGKFEIKDAPVGKFNLVFWHEMNGWKGGRQGRTGQAFPLTPGKTAIPVQELKLTK